MIAAKKKYKKGILAFHAYQSLAKGEVTTEVAHKVGIKFAEGMLGDRFEVVVSTHLWIAIGYNYSYRAGKLSIRREIYKRKIRVERALGEEYSMDKIRNRIYKNPIRKNKNIPWVKSLNRKN